MNGYRYNIDRSDRICSVDEAWLDFARENGAGHLTEPSVIGRRLWEFISGRETQHLYRLIFERVRESGQTTVVPFRCDSPRCRRFMELSVAPAESDGLELLVRVLREESRVHVNLLDVRISRDDRFLEICSWCKCVRVDEDHWFEVEEAIRRLQLFLAPELPSLTHGLCRPCESSLLK